MKTSIFSGIGLLGAYYYLHTTMPPTLNIEIDRRKDMVHRLEPKDWRTMDPIHKSLIMPDKENKLLDVDAPFWKRPRCLRDAQTQREKLFMAYRVQTNTHNFDWVNEMNTRPKYSGAIVPV